MNRITSYNVCYTKLLRKGKYGCAWFDKSGEFVKHEDRFLPFSDIESARLVQVEAIAADENGFINNLMSIMWLLPRHMPNSSILISCGVVSKLLQATPRQISEAAYLTLNKERVFENDGTSYNFV